MNKLQLPNLMLFEDYSGVWNDYLEAIYYIFHHDFVINRPFYNGRRLGLKRYPEHQGKSATFWHMTSTGNDESERIPDFRRCERIGWPKIIIDNSIEPCLKVWIETRNSNKRIHIWFESEDYLVVLDDRGDFILPWTAFYIERNHEREKYNKRWEKYR